MDGLLAGETSLLSDRKSNDPPIAFGSNIPRRMFPFHTAPTRLGIEQGLRGEPHRGPGLYQPHPIKLFLQPLDMRPKSRAGWYFGCRTGSRSLPDPKCKTPGPPHYQKISMKHFYQDQRPFGAVCSRFPASHYHTLAPGSGHYDHNIATNRTIDFHESFGGRKTLKETVKIKCTKGIPEQCVGCNSSPVGDYYEGVYSDDILCPTCYNTIKNAKNPMRDKDIRGYHKVRDCSSIHKHEFVGFPPKIILRGEKETKRLKHKEAYFRLYYTD